MTTWQKVRVDNGATAGLMCALAGSEGSSSASFNLLSSEERVADLRVSSSQCKEGKEGKGFGRLIAHSMLFCSESGPSPTYPSASSTSSLSALCFTLVCRIHCTSLSQAFSLPISMSNSSEKMVISSEEQVAPEHPFDALPHDRAFVRHAACSVLV